MFGLYCIMLSGTPLNEELRNLLCSTTREMFQEKINYKILKTSWCEGDLKTDWDRSSLGSTVGYLFQAFVEWGNKSTTVNFIIQDADFPDNGVWVSEMVSPFGSINQN